MKRESIYLKIWYLYVIVYIIYFMLQEVIPVRNFLHDNLDYPELFTAV